MKASRRLSDKELQDLFGKAHERHKNGFLEEACSCYLQLLDYFPDVPVLHYNLGLVFYEQGEFGKAQEAFTQAASFNPQDMDILFNLALCRKQLGNLEGAIVTFKQVLEAEPESLDALYNLGGCYRESRQYELARDAYLELLRFEPAHQQANNNLAYIYHRTGEKEKAVLHYEKVLECNPGHSSARHMLAALSGRKATSSPDSYIIEVFDNYSANYEQSLVAELEYRVPAAIRALIDGSPLEKRRYDHGLDLGCGTGLGGKAFVDLVDVLDGIDLSQDMLALAAEKNIYRHLYCSNILSFLESSSERFDFYLAADVFAYVGDLAQTFSLLKKCAKADADFYFSTETADGSGYFLQENGRFAHSTTYITDLAENTGWRVVASESSGLRRENGKWVAGNLWILNAS